MKFSLSTFIGLLCFITMFIPSSCTQKDFGCTDARASNYDATAEENCCCSFDETVFSFYTMNAAYNSIDVYIDAAYWGNVSSVYNAVPECSDVTDLVIPVTPGNHNIQVNIDGGGLTTAQSFFAAEYECNLIEIE